MYIDYFIPFCITKIKTTRSYLSVCVSSLLTYHTSKGTSKAADARCRVFVDRRLLPGTRGPYPSRMRRLQLNGVRVFYRPFVWQGRGRR